MSCKFGYDDCIADRSKCLFCTNGMSYEEPKKRYSIKKKTQKPDKRMGSEFEYANHERNKAVLSSKMTLNSGATKKEKGDENLVIGGFRLMEELKTQEPTRGKGCKTFTIKREWLNKLHVEAIERGFDAWHLKFAFNEAEASSTRAEKFSDGNPAGNIFIVIEQDVIMSLIQRLAQDEIKADGIDKKLDFYQKKNQALEAENVALQAKTKALEAKLRLLEPSERKAKIQEGLDRLMEQ